MQQVWILEHSYLVVVVKSKTCVSMSKLSVIEPVSECLPDSVNVCMCVCVSVCR